MKKKSKIIAVLCIAVLSMCGITACGSQNENRDNTGGGNAGASSDAEASSGSDTSSGGEGQTMDGKKVLVAYFSATGTTKALAEHAAAALGAELYEIVPKEPYSDADLDYSDDSSRSTKEMNDTSSRPEISGSVENMEQYDVILLGYPIWWGEAPRIMDTFVESYDFSGKTIVPFCTSGGSGIGSSAENLEKVCKGDAKWLEGARLGSDSGRDDMAEWINGLGIGLQAK